MTLKSIRAALGRTQRELADLLGISVRAVQSYEQRWRAVPPCVDKLSRLLLFLEWRRDQGDVPPCWMLLGCTPDARARCPAYAHGDGECCWLITGDAWRGERQKSWEEKMGRCQDCPAMRRWLHNGDGHAPASGR